MSDEKETANPLEEQIELQTNETSEKDMVVNKERSTSNSISKMKSEYTESTALQNQVSHRIDPTKWFGLFRGYIRQDWHTVIVDNGIDELRANWVELFFDLIYVACIVHLSAEAAISISHTQSHRRLANTSKNADDNIDEHCRFEWKYSFLLTGFAQFGLLTNAWRQQVMYVTHFVFNQRLDDALRLLFMLCILSMGIFIKDEESYNRGFLISYGWLQCVSILMFLKVLLIPRGKWHAIWNIMTAAIILAIIIIILPSVRGGCALDYFGIYVAFFLFETFAGYGPWVLSSACHCKPPISIPLNVPHISERYGLFIMLILGESIISIMSWELGDEINLEERFVWKTDGSPPSQILVIFVLLTFILSYCIARLYYDCQPTEEAILSGHHNHALRISKKTGRMYMYAHQFLFFGLLGLGMGIKITGKHLLETKKRWIDVVLPGYSLVVIIISLNFIRIAHPYNVDRKIWIFRGILLLIMMIAPLFSKTVNQGGIFVVIFSCIVLLLFVDVEGREKIKNEKEDMKERRELAKQESDADNNNNLVVPPQRFKHMKRMTSGVGIM